MPNSTSPYDAARSLLTETHPEELEHATTLLPAVAHSTKHPMGNVANPPAGYERAEFDRRFKPHSEADVDHLRAIFSVVQSEVHWKQPGAAIVPRESVPDIAKAVEFFTASPTYYASLSDGTALIYFPGYYRACGA